MANAEKFCLLDSNSTVLNSVRRRAVFCCTFELRQNNLLSQSSHFCQSTDTALYSCTSVGKQYKLSIHLLWVLLVVVFLGPHHCMLSSSPYPLALSHFGENGKVRIYKFGQIMRITNFKSHGISRYMAIHVHFTLYVTPG